MNHSIRKHAHDEPKAVIVIISEIHAETEISQYMMTAKQKYLST